MFPVPRFRENAILCVLVRNVAGFSAETALFVATFLPKCPSVRSTAKRGQTKVLYHPIKPGFFTDKNADLRKQWCRIFENLSTFAICPDNLDSSFDDIIKDAGTCKLTTKQKIEYMEALHLNERERLVVYEGGYQLGKADGIAEGEAKGKAEAMVTIARNLLGMGMPLADIVKVTGLPEEKVGDLK